MIRFKEFLAEASTGKAAWEKYFASGNVETTMKTDSPLLDADGKPTGETLKKGDKIVVIGGEYSTKPLIKVKGSRIKNTVSFTAIDKPFKKEMSVSVPLKPDNLKIFGATPIIDLGKKIKRAIAQFPELTPGQTEYLKVLVDLSRSPDSAPLQKKAKELFSAHIKGDNKLIATINNDFMEVLGPFFVVKQKPEFNAGGAKFPENGSEPLYDFTMKAERGEDKPITMFSSKRSGGSTNTLKVASVLKATLANPAMKRKYKKEIELLTIIDQNPTKAAPQLINAWLKLNFPSYKLAKPPKDLEETIALEKNVVKFINEKSGLEFDVLIRTSIPDLWYVRSRLNGDGTLKVERLESGRELSKVKFRQKSSTGRMSDKLGFAV